MTGMRMITFNPADWVRMAGARLGWWSVVYARIYEKQLTAYSNVKTVMRVLRGTGLQDNYRAVKVGWGWHNYDSLCVGDRSGQGRIVTWREYKLRKEDEEWLIAADIARQLRGEGEYALEQQQAKTASTGMGISNIMAGSISTSQLQASSLSLSPDIMQQLREAQMKMAQQNVGLPLTPAETEIDAYLKYGGVLAKRYYAPKLMNLSPPEGY
ncbi:MAG TPA: hypothetical protein VF077_09435 [Nitrospiraceae bacterium]